MFYLVEFFKVMKSNIVLSILFLLSTTGLVFIGSQYTAVYNNLMAQSRPEASGPYFSALIDKEMKLESIIRRVQNLPGVSKVEVSAQSSLRNEVEKLQETFGSDFVKDLNSIKLKNITVLLESGVQKRSFTLIKEYIERLVGKSEVTIGALKYPDTKHNQIGEGLQFILSYVNIYGLFILGGLWFISFILMVKLIHSKAFIIEKFQRRTLVTYKIIYSGLGAIILVGTVSHYLLLGEIDIVLAAVISCMFFIGLALIKFIPKKFVGV